MDQLIQEIANLKEQETTFLAQLVTAETEVEERALTNELNIVRNKLSEKQLELEKLQEKEQQRAEVIEELVNAEPVPFSALGINLNGAPVEVIELAEGIYRATRRICLIENATKFEQVEKELTLAKQDVAQKLERLQAHSDEIARLRDDNSQLAFEKADAELKRDAAVDEREYAELQLKYAQEEISRLRSEVEDYQRAKVFGEREAQQIIDITPEETTTLQEKADAVKKLFATVEDWGSIQKVIKPDGSFELATRAEVEAEWAPVEAPEVPRFRDETEVVAPEVAADVSQFQGDGDTTEQRKDSADVNGTDVEHGGTQATLEERVAKLEAAVFGWQAVA